MTRERLAELHLAAARQRLVDAGDQKWQAFAEMSEHAFEIRIFLKYPGQHKAYRGRCSLDGEAPAGRQNGRRNLHILLVIPVDDDLLGRSRMEIDRHIELLGAFVNRPESRVVKKNAVGKAMQHRAMKAELGHTT